MGSLCVVEAIDVAAERGAGLGDICISPQVNFLVFECPPKPLDEHIVPPRSLAIHADQNVVLHEQAGEGDARKLTALIRVEDLRLAISMDRFLNGLNAKIGLERDR